LSKGAAESNECESEVQGIPGMPNQQTDIDEQGRLSWTAIAGGRVTAAAQIQQQGDSSRGVYSGCGCKSTDEAQRRAQQPRGSVAAGGQVSR